MAREFREVNEELQIVVCEETCSDSSHRFLTEKLLNLEEEQELLYSSIFSLTTYIARIQLHLNQIINAPLDEEKETLLESLQKLASFSPEEKIQKLDEINQLSDSKNMNRKNQRKLINSLKIQLNQLEQNTRRNIIRLENEGKQLQLQELGLKENCVKNNLIKQLKNQITDLENSVQEFPERNNFQKNQTNSKRKLNEKSCNPVSVVLKMFLTLERNFMKNIFFNFDTNNWHKMQERFDKAINLIKTLVNTKIDEENSKLRTNYDRNLTMAVRKYLATSLRDLMQHGAMQLPTYRSNLIKPFINSCFYLMSASKVHSWQIILSYYQLKRGFEQNSTAIMTLSESYNLDIGNVSRFESKQDMLYMIGNIISIHSCYNKCSYDSHFKAFVSAGLNANRLVFWLKSIFQCNRIIESHYYSWSYVSKTMFQDSLESLDRLTGCKFNLPVDFAVRKYRNIVDVFS